MSHVSRLRCCISFLADYYGWNVLPTILSSSDAIRGVGQGDSTAIFAILKFLYNILNSPDPVVAEYRGVTNYKNKEKTLHRASEIEVPTESVENLNPNLSLSKFSIGLGSIFNYSNRGKRGNVEQPCEYFFNRNSPSSKQDAH